MSLNVQFYTIISMIAMGSYLGAALDTYHFFINRSKRNWLIFMNDVLFWIIQALLFFYVLFQVNEGELRLYAFLAVLCGFAAYQSLFQTIYLLVLKIFIHIVVQTYRFIVQAVEMLIIKPLSFLVQLLLIMALFIWRAVLFWGQIAWKAIWMPTKWIINLVWRLLPKKVKHFLCACFTFLEGIYNKIKNTKKRMKEWIHYFRNKEEK